VVVVVVVVAAAAQRRLLRASSSSKSSSDQQIGSPLGWGSAKEIKLMNCKQHVATIRRRRGRRPLFALHHPLCPTKARPSLRSDARATCLAHTTNRLPIPDIPHLSLHPPADRKEKHGLKKPSNLNKKTPAIARERQSNAEQAPKIQPHRHERQQRLDLDSPHQRHGQHGRDAEPQLWRPGRQEDAPCRPNCRRQRRHQNPVWCSVTSGANDRAPVATCRRNGVGRSPERLSLQAHGLRSVHLGDREVHVGRRARAAAVAAATAAASAAVRAPQNEKQKSYFAATRLFRFFSRLVVRHIFDCIARVFCGTRRRNKNKPHTPRCARAPQSGPHAARARTRSLSETKIDPSLSSLLPPPHP
jgi:hypothetical protein